MPLSLGSCVEGSCNSYVVEKTLSVGGMGRVFLGRSSEGKKVVIKEPNFTGDSSDLIKLQKLKVEAEILNKVDHRNIVKSIDYQDLGKTFYLILDFVPGKTLRDTFRNKPARENEALRHSLAILDALQYLHTINIIHRDINPGNILLPSNIVLIDFGAAKHGYTHLPNSTRTIIGTPGWSAPEQFSGIATPPSDIYSVGATIFFLLTGHPPTQHMRANWTVDSPREKNPTVSKNMEQVVLTAMHPDPSKRFQIAEDMADAIRGNYIGRGIPYVFCNGRKYPLEKTLRIGRSPDCDIFVKDPQLYVSEQHAEIYVKRSKFWIRDLRSTNGTFILQQGKFIRIKKTELRENVLIALCHDPRKGPYVTLSFSPNI